MKKFAVLALLVWGTWAQAQAPAATPSSPAKKELVTKVLALQQGAIEQVAQAVVERPALQMMQQASLALQTRVAPDKREAIAKKIQEDLNKYAADVGPKAREQAVKLGPSTIGVLLDEKFTEAELKELIGIMESPVNRKFAQMAPEFQKALAEKLVAQSKASVDPKVKALEQAIVMHLDLPAPAPAKPASQLLGAPKK
ncbi:MAG: hypothetical protein AUJ20_09640 [Comamonadaceae bacterium CG1_02_60_18]|nr:MAG: hypothetical protein AUJ20_09640 [Comamonadaceae bacterium CG1_02_60_18]PIQ52655.1 MAG: hypothetical protein COW02_10235 [Comamonadaceae bacterium CG12_big_fil_rev_8_21_14_0_65_59_15]